MLPILTAFANSPDGGEGHARDMRVRWALEEAGIEYEVRLVPMDRLRDPENLARHPFGKIPTYQDGDLVLFESGAICLHIAERSEALLPADEAGRERARMWLFAALNTVEPPIIEREAARVLEKEEDWFAARGKLLDERVHERLAQLADFLGPSEWLDGAFSVGDLMMVMVLRRLEDGPNLLKAHPNLLAYVARGEARPAYRRAYAAQRAVFLDAQT